MFLDLYLARLATNLDEKYRTRPSLIKVPATKKFPFRKASLRSSGIAVRKRPLLQTPSLRDAGFKKPANSTAIQRICRICRSGLIRDVGSARGKERGIGGGGIEARGPGAGGVWIVAWLRAFMSPERVPRSHELGMTVFPRTNRREIEIGASSPRSGTKSPRIGSRVALKTSGVRPVAELWLAVSPDEF